MGPAPSRSVDSFVFRNVSSDALKVGEDTKAKTAYMAGRIPYFVSRNCCRSSGMTDVSSCQVRSLRRQAKLG